MLFGDSRVNPSLWAKTERRASGCWLWHGSRQTRGLPVWDPPESEGGGQVLVGRYLYKKLVGPIPDGKVVSRDCEDMRCVSPEHAVIRTMSEAIKAGIQRVKAGGKARFGTDHEHDARRARRVKAEGLCVECKSIPAVEGKLCGPCVVARKVRQALVHGERAEARALEAILTFPHEVK